MISFVTSIKIGKGYEDYVHRLRMYLENLLRFPYTYEVIVVEDQCSLNQVYIADVFTKEEQLHYHLKIIVYTATYPNPFGYPMIEAFAKNKGIQEAVYPFICVTNADILFHDFEFIPHLLPKHFYRFIVYEIPVPQEWTYSPQLYNQQKCLNPFLLDKTQWTVQNIAYKSGDCMLLDKTSWMDIKGFPENTVWTHSDYVVCKIVCNRGLPLVISSTPIYTYEQSPKHSVLSQEELSILKSYEYKQVCN